MSFDDRIAVVTAGGSGMGRATALRLASKGATVFIADIDPNAAEDFLQPRHVQWALR